VRLEVNVANPTHLSRRERQIMDSLYARGEAGATQVLEDLPDPPTRTAVRTILRILEAKGHVKHRQQGREFIYSPIAPRERSGQSALRRVLQTFFGGSLEKALAAHFTDPKATLSPAERKRLTELIKQARPKQD